MTTYTIMSIGEIDIYLGFAEPAEPTLEVMTMAKENPICSVRRGERVQDPGKIEPTQPTPVLEEVVEEKSRLDLPVEIGYIDEEYILYGSGPTEAVAEKVLLRNMIKKMMKCSYIDYKAITDIKESFEMAEAGT